MLSRSSRIVAVVLAAVYLVFWFWYGGNGDPLTETEKEAFFERLTELQARAAHPDPAIQQAFETLVTQDDGREYYMLNLMKYREKAQYPPGYDYDDDVQAAADRYSRAVGPGLIKRGSLPVLLGGVQGRFLHFDGADDWDDVAIVRYRSRRDMLAFALELGEKDEGVHKWASIEKTHVFPVEPVFDLVFVRGAVAALLMGLGIVLVLALRLFRLRREAG